MDYGVVGQWRPIPMAYSWQRRQRRRRRRQRRYFPSCHPPKDGGP